MSKLPPRTIISDEEHLDTIDNDRRDHLSRQVSELNPGGNVTCKCAFSLPVVNAYRCLYCGEWFCASCAEEHFGKTRSTWFSDREKGLC